MSQRIFFNFKKFKFIHSNISVELHTNDINHYHPFHSSPKTWQCNLTLSWFNDWTRNTHLTQATSSPQARKQLMASVCVFVFKSWASQISSLVIWFLGAVEINQLAGEVAARNHNIVMLFYVYAAVLFFFN